ncbi:hypothetical protein ONZ45_g627 [Pleurotus djamor]|nr:hypothetical protein ONZ45_g627 [Pleurotus djamor]
MGPGSRRDTLDDHFGDYNWRKVINMHETLLRRIKEAVPTQTEEDAALAQRENDFVMHKSVSPSVLISQGLDLEDQQARLVVDAKLISSGSTDIQRTKIIERQTRLICRIAGWSAIQEHYMPGVSSLRQPTASSPMAQGELFPLILPSSPLCPARINIKLAHYEWRLRYGKALDCLAEIRHLLLVLSLMYQSKSKYSRGQQQNTWSVSLIGNVQQHINHTVQRYRVSQTALEGLAKRLKKSGWESMILPLQDSDVRSLKEGDDAGSSEGRRRLSWIWSAQHTSDSKFVKGKNEALRIEWCKARTRAHRWQEECILLSEEMCRVVAFHTWQAGVWNRRAHQEAQSPGAAAYAWRQESVRLILAQRCKKVWILVEAWVSMGEGAILVGERFVEQHEAV